MEADLKSALRTIEETFGDRLKQEEAPGEGGPRDEAPFSVLPRNAEEVELLAEVAARHGVPLTALGAGTVRDARPKAGSVLARFDLMRGVEIRGDGEEARAEPGATWLELEEGLGTRGRGLAVYPTSAPRATVGGWLAEDGIGVGSYRYGRSRENVLSADVVLAGGRRRTVGGEELGPVLDAEGGEGILVAAALRTRRADRDVPFALAFGSPGDLAEAAGDVHRAGAPLWHLALLNGAMARARDLGDDGLLFGAYPGEKAAEEALREAAASRNGRVLPAAEAYRVWGQRFFPVAPSRPTPSLADRSFVSMDEIGEALKGREARAVQATFARSGQALILDLGPLEGEPTR